MTHWQDILLKSKQIKWGSIKPKSLEDGKLDFILTLRLTALFETQAKLSFAYGVLTTLQFLAQKQTIDKETITTESLKEFLTECGLPELVKVMIPKLGKEP